MTRIEVLPGGAVDGRLAAPASKSVTNRMLVIAALAEGTSVLHGPLDSDDTRAMQEAVRALGATVTEGDEAWTVEGTGGHLRLPEVPISARLSGTTMRFVAAAAVLAPGRVELTGEPGLLRRPIGPLTASLRALGAEVSDDEGYPPVVAEGGGLTGGVVEVDATASSQFASAVLLVSPYAHQPSTVIVRGAASAAYVSLTAAVMRAWGAEVSMAGSGTWEVSPGPYQAREAAVEYDASAAAHLLSVAAATGGTVRVTNAVADTDQPDAAFAQLLSEMGATTSRDADELILTGPAQLRPIDVDLGAMPDQVATVAVLAALAEGTSEIRGVAVTRGHETDRLAALAAELGKVGVVVEEQPDGLVVHGGTAAGPALLDPHSDHRLAMAFAALGSAVPALVISDAECVDKTYPDFWEDVRRLGVVWRHR